MSIYEGSELAKNAANHVALSPVSTLSRTALVHPERTAVIYGELRRTWGEVDARCRRLASALAQRGIGKGDTVALLAPNIPEALECALGVPMIGAVLNANNTRLDAGTIAYILEHGDAKALLVDTELSGIAKDAVAQLDSPPLVIDICDPTTPGERIGSVEYEDLLAEGDPQFEFSPPQDEWDTLSLNYTSGTTGRPKGVVYSHRGAYINAVNNTITWAMPHFPVYLWTLPMFHCNGWCFPWTITLLAGTHVFLRAPRAKPIFDAIADHKVTHMCGAPIIMSLISDATSEETRAFDHTVEFMTAAAPPPASVIAGIEGKGFHITHVYGLTEVYGPAVVCAWKPEWDALPVADRARKKARQGVPYELQEDVQVLDPETGKAVPRDGQTQGEIVFRGNIIMKGYLKSPEQTAKAFKDGWFWSGDLAVQHPDGYVEIRDRAKDIIISGGENISSIEVENVIVEMEAVAFAAVVARPDDKWGEVPCAFVELKPGAELTQDDVIEHCRSKLAGYMRPKLVVQGMLPKTSTGKILKHLLRDLAKAEAPDLENLGD
ncbi:AMP-binding protein [Epibacterium sp. SM1979]|uniref:3-methylmercaptopropionyl-CoA ligase n=1 Tax=Tritonibacter litoralis TaxID=2662264 RepID=A0A843YNZ6_9RHOB|nr:acyl-CoA synthetase [Tritonibacter litoralis]MQQ10337.1 AMP-binding protein [Tritonibacter litoralis]